jgi:hypothetical protein
MAPFEFAVHGVARTAWLCRDSLVALLRVSVMPFPVNPKWILHACRTCKAIPREIVQPAACGKFSAYAWRIDLMAIFSRKYFEPAQLRFTHRLGRLIIPAHSSSHLPIG